MLISPALYRGGREVLFEAEKKNESFVKFVEKFGPNICIGIVGGEGSPTDGKQYFFAFGRLEISWTQV